MAFDGTLVVSELSSFPLGGRVSYSPARGLLAFDRSANNKDKFEVWIGNLSGAATCITCDMPGLPPNTHRGNPAWSPDGNWITIQVEFEVNTLPFPGYATPGLALQNNVWVINYQELIPYQLTSLVGDEGALHPQWNPAGTGLIWAQKCNRQWEWFLHSATFAQNPPRLIDDHQWLPLGNGLYETHEFDDTGQLFLFTHRFLGVPGWGLNTYRITNMRTNPIPIGGGVNADWDEQAHYTRDQQEIIWMTSRGCDCDPYSEALRTELWAVPANNPVGGAARQLTFFNTAGHDHASYTGDMETVVVGDFVVIDGQRIAAYVISGVPGAGELSGLETRKGAILLLENT